MGSKVWVVLNWGVLIVVTLAAVWMVLGFPDGEDSNGYPDGEVPLFFDDCVDVNKIDEFEYEACYDAYSEMIFLKVTRGKGNYEVDGLRVSFVDIASQSYDLEDVPESGEDRAYRFLAKKNPGRLSVMLDVARDFSGSVCGGKNVFVDYCPVGTGGEGIGVLISPIEGVGIRDFIEVEDLPYFDSDVVVMDLVEKEKIWKSICRSNWECGGWEACGDDVQHRDCRDSNNCIVPTDSPVSVQRCDGTCVEAWECEWGGCEDGFSVPSCRDSNSCGTSYNVPEKLSCEERGKCVPDVICEAWTDCDVDYDFIDLVGMDGVMQLDGSKTRLCVDGEGCVLTQKEERNCSIGVDIYTKRFDRCGESYVGVYDILDDSTLAILKEGVGANVYLNIYFGEVEEVYCDYCFDGEMNGDEEDVDCGGSCRDCKSRTPYVERHWWDFIF